MTGSGRRSRSQKRTLRVKMAHFRLRPRDLHWCGMQRLLLRTARWIGAATLAVVVSAMYARGFFYTNPAIILGAFAVCIVVMSAPVLVGVRPRLNPWFWAYAIGFALGLTFAIPAAHDIWLGTFDFGWLLRDIFSIGSIEVIVHIIMLLFAGIVGTSLLAPSPARKVAR